MFRLDGEEVVSVEHLTDMSGEDDAAGGEPDAGPDPDEPAGREPGADA